MAKALSPEKRPTSRPAQGESTFKQQLSPGELRVYIHFLRHSLRENPEAEPIIRALEAEKHAERKHR